MRQMRRTILVIPGLLSGPESESDLRQKLPHLSAMAEMGVLQRVATPPANETPEAMLLGMSPATVDLRQGPLTVSAFGFDPPGRSTHFHLSLMSLSDNVLTLPRLLPKPEDLDVLMAAAVRLNTKLLTVLKGETLDNALVWEALGDLGTKSPAAVGGQNIFGSLPEGDGENQLRRFIDDSVNLLSSLELNERRVDEGLPPFNVLWPWGHGIRTPVPNLALLRGEPAHVESASIRLAGLTRLAGYRHGDRSRFGKGLKTQLREIAGRCVDRTVSIVYISSMQELRSDDNHEECEWFVRELDRELLGPLLNDHLKTPSRLDLIAPPPVGAGDATNTTASEVGLALSVETHVVSSNIFPFDERSLDEKILPKVDLWSLVAAGLAP